MNRTPFSWRKRAHSFGYAFDGLSALFRTEHNAWIHAALTIFTIAASLYFRVTATEACLLVIVIMAVWTAEIFNTCIEKIMDHITPDRHPQVKLVKDLAAAAVLVTAVAAVVTGFIIFLPKIF